MAARALVAVISQPYAGELPPGFRREKVAIRCANVRLRSNARTSAQHHLVAHKFSVVLAQRSSHRLVSRIRKIGAGRPLPNVAEHLYRLVRVLRLCRAWMEPAGFEQIAFRI